MVLHRRAQAGGCNTGGAEESFPKLWDRQPETALRLLLESCCQPVHVFAGKLLRDRPDVLATLTTDAIVVLLGSPYPTTVRLAVTVAADRYDPANPDIDLVVALANGCDVEGRTLARDWISAQPEWFLAEGYAIAALLLSPQGDMRSFARELLQAAVLPEPAIQTLLARLLSAAIALEASQAELATELCSFLFETFAAQLQHLGLPVITDLLQHPLESLQILGGNILANHAIAVADLPSFYIDALLSSPHATVRSLGMELFGRFPEAALRDRAPLLLAFATHELPDLRESVRPVLRKLAIGNTTFAMRLTDELARALLVREKHEGVHALLVKLLVEDLPNWEEYVSLATARKLLRSKFSAAQELGGRALQRRDRDWTEHLTTTEIVRLASHEILAVREAAWKLMQCILPRVRGSETEMLAGIRILESTWEDSRSFGTTFFGSEFDREDFTPTVLVALCDSNHPDVRSFGRGQIDRYFQSEDGPEYLLRFSEHPSTDMQLFAANYLETYAAGNLERLQQLRFFFTCLLARVNRGRVAKQKAIAFLESEARKSEEAARLAIEILEPLSATFAVGDRAAAVRVLLDIHRAYPNLPSRLHVKPVTEIRH